MRLLLASASLTAAAQGFLLLPTHPQPAIHPTTTSTRLFMMSNQGGLSGDVARASTQPQQQQPSKRQQQSPQDFARPDWLAELIVAKESKILRFPYELRRLEWTPEDDATVDAMLMQGQMEEAEKYFEEKKATSVPMYRQTLRYHWTQTEEELHVGVPVPKAVRGANMHLIVAEDALQLALTDMPSFGVIAGKFAGEIDPTKSGWQLVQRPDGSYSVSMTLKKAAQPGTHSLWYQLLQGEQLATSMAFRGTQGPGGYHWNQDLEYMNLFIPVPADVRGKAVQLTIDEGGRSMEVSWPQDGDAPRVRVGGEFSGFVSPDECSWVIDDDEHGQRCICLSLQKRRRQASESTWWSRCFKEEESVAPPELQQQLDDGKEKARQERERFERALDGLLE